MGFLVKNQCYATQQLADAAFYQVQPVAAFGTSTTYVTRFVNVSGNWFLQRTTYNNAGVVTQQKQLPAPIMSYPACDENSPDFFLDGVNQTDAIFTAILVFALIIGFGQGFRL